MRPIGLFLVIATLTLHAATSSAYPKDPPAQADVAAASGPSLSPADLTSLEDAVKVYADAERDAQTAKLIADRAAVSQDRATINFDKTRFRILALHKLSPEEYDVQLVERKLPDGSSARAWAIVPAKRATPAPPK